jgi:hypothetical protein
MLPQEVLNSLPPLLPEQDYLRPWVPTVVGNLEFRVWRNQLERIDEILRLGQVEEAFVRLSLVRQKEREKLAAADDRRPVHLLTPGEQVLFQRRASQALRCMLVRTLTGEGLRPFARHLAESSLLPWFCRLDRLEQVQIPSKSQLQRQAELVEEADLRTVVTGLLETASRPTEAGGGQVIGLRAALELDTYFLDSTGVKLNIHFPVDWVLLRDAARTLVKAILLIRKRGLKRRMQEPQVFLKQMNRLAMEMTRQGRRSGNKKARKATLRAMKRLMRVIREHAQRHRDLLAKRWQETDLSQAEAANIVERIEVILERLPYAIRQAHERIIGERQVLNEEKILSLYEGHAAVYVRGKAGAEVEFGSQLLLGEADSGVIVDWELVCGNPERDTQLLKQSLDRYEAARGGKKPAAVTGDRGFDSQANREELAGRKIYNGICPKAPAVLKQRMRERRFVRLQQRRSQTEARIAIFKNGFLGAPLRVKGYSHQNLQVAWAVLTHNLWCLARLPRERTVEVTVIH